MENLVSLCLFRLFLLEFIKLNFELMIFGIQVINFNRELFAGFVRIRVISGFFELIFEFFNFFLQVLIFFAELVIGSRLFLLLCDELLNFLIPCAAVLECIQLFLHTVLFRFQTLHFFFQLGLFFAVFFHVGFLFVVSLIPAVSFALFVLEFGSGSVQAFLEFCHFDFTLLDVLFISTGQIFPCLEFAVVLSGLVAFFKLVSIKLDKNIILPFSVLFFHDVQALSCHRMNAVDLILCQFHN